MARNDINVARAFVTFRGAQEDRAYRSSSLHFAGHWIYSYDMPLGRRMLHNDKRFVLVNGDGWPTRATAKHQSTLQDALELEKVAHAFVPFSTCESAGIVPEEIDVVNVTADHTEVETYNKADGTKGARHTHYLGETLFKFKDRYYVCGLDRNDNPKKRMFYLCRLPERVVPYTTVDEALESLRPSVVPSGSPRQGEWFFVPEKHVVTESFIKKTPVFSDKGPAQNDFIKNRKLLGDRHGRHVAAEMFTVADLVFVRGDITDNEHDTCKLDKKVWHRVVKNRADDGWRYTRQNGVGVD